MKEDRRIRRTKSAIKEAFIDLLNEKKSKKLRYKILLNVPILIGDILFTL